MQLNHIKSLHSAQSGIARVPALAWTPNNKRLAIADHARSIQLYDESGERRDKFGLKSAEGKAGAGFVVRAMAFSPDSVKLAIAQSDYIVFVYKLGLEWGERKAICNKFPQQSPVTCLCWPPSISDQDFFVFGTTEGKVRIAVLKTNKSQTLFSHDSPVVSVTHSPDGVHVLSGHQDGSLMHYMFDETDSAAQKGAVKLATHPCVPYGIGWGEGVAATGSDCKVVFYDRSGRATQTFDFPPEDDRDMTVAAFNPGGQTLAVGAYEKLRLFNFNLRSRKWEEGAVIPVKNSYAFTALTWKFDGSRLITGTLCGAVDVFDACLKRYRLRGAFEFTYVSHNQVIVKRLATGTRIVLKSHLGYEIQRVNVHKDRFLVAHTATTLLLGDLVTCSLSEVTWQLSGREQFLFDNPQVCMVHVAGELSLIEYGRNEMLHTCRTDQTNMHRLSVRIRQQPEGTNDQPSKAIAYLIDRQTIQVDDLVTFMKTRISHNVKIDWLELNHSANKVLFRDKQNHLLLFDLLTQTKTTLLNFCTYVQWVPDSDVVVAQNRGDLCVWYSIDSPDRVTVVPIKGEVEGIERSPGKTEVIVDEGASTVAYSLDEALIGFGLAMETKDYDRACDLLDEIALNPETEAMWQSLSTLALADMKLYIAERCAAALGDVAKARALKHINKLGKEHGYDHYSVRAELYVLNKEFKRAEAVYLENGQVDQAIAMWEEMQRFDEAIAVAEARNHPDAANQRSRYMDWLKVSKQDEKAGELCEREGKYRQAIEYYLRGGVPARAAHVVSAYNERPDQQLLEAIAAALLRAEIFEKAGDFFEKLDMNERAIDAYKKGHVFRRAVELARREFPTEVTKLEEQWADWLVSQKQVDQAINHYIECHKYDKAIDSAISSRQWSKAVNIIETQNVGGAADPQVQKFYKQIGAHYEEAAQLSEAEKYYVKADAISEAVEMYSRRSETDHMLRVAQRHWTQEQIVQLFTAQAKQLESKGDYAAAEAIYIKVNEPDKAIVMYKKVRDFNNMIRLVSAFRPDLVGPTHLKLGAQFEKEKNYKQAEQHFISGKDWNRAASMYREAGMWDDAVRIAKVHGGASAAKQVVLTRAMNVDAQDGVSLLAKFSLLDAGIEGALEVQKFDLALQWAQLGMPQKLPYVFLKNAMFLEDQGEFRNAEEAFVKAGKPREAIEMYLHQQDFDSAMRVAEGHDAAGIPVVCNAQGRATFQQGNFAEAENLMLRANAPKGLLELFKDAGMLSDAQRIAREYCPDELPGIGVAIGRSTRDPLQAANIFEDNGDYSLAIDSYLRAGQEHTSDINALAQGWLRAVKLSAMHARHTLKDTLKTAVSKLVENDRMEEGAKCLEENEDYKAAITIYVRGGKFDQADTLAHRISPEMVDYVKRERMRILIENGGATAETGDVDNEEVLRAHVANNDWDRALKLARQMGDDQARAHAALYVQALLKEKNVSKALDVIKVDGVETHDFRFYKTFTELGLQACMAAPDEGLDFSGIHDGLYAIVEDMKRTGQPQEDVDRSQAVLDVLHIYATAPALKAAEMSDFGAMLMSSLPRHVDIIPADKAYYDAGVAAKDIDDFGTAFVFLNRYLDICDKIEDEEPTSESLDNSDFVSTDFPFMFNLPSQLSIQGKIAEDVKDWVLAKSVDTGFDPSLPTLTEPRTGATMHVAALRTQDSSETFESCAITGQPVLPTLGKVRCKSCNRAAVQSNWVKYIMAQKQCPWCKTHQTVDFH